MKNPELLTEYLKGKYVAIIYLKSGVREEKGLRKEDTITGYVRKILTGVDDIYIVLEPDIEYWVEGEETKEKVVEDFEWGDFEYSEAIQKLEELKDRARLEWLKSN